MRPATDTSFAPLREKVVPGALSCVLDRCLTELLSVVCVRAQFSPCAAHDRAECYYRRRRPRSQTTRHPASTPAYNAEDDDDAGHRFWRADSDKATALSRNAKRPAAATNGAADNRVLPLPLKR